MTAVSPALAEVQRIAHLAESLKISAERLCTSLTTGVESGDETLQGLRLQHQRGNRPRLATDAELRSFVVARIATATFDQVVRAVAESFPPERRVSRSALHRWWHRSGKHLSVDRL